MSVIIHSACMPQVTQMTWYIPCPMVPALVVVSGDIMINESKINFNSFNGERDTFSFLTSKMRMCLLLVGF